MNLNKQTYHETAFEQAVDNQMERTKAMVDAVFRHSIALKISRHVSKFLFTKVPGLMELSCLSSFVYASVVEKTTVMLAIYIQDLEELEELHHDLSFGCLDALRVWRASKDYDLANDQFLRVLARRVVQKRINKVGE
jgi:hypothetical protein